MSKEHKTEESDDISFNFSKIKSFFKGKKKHHKNDDEVDVNLKSVWSFFVKYKTIFLILIPIILCIVLRAQPFYLPITDNWAEQTVHGYYKNQIQSQFDQQYPNLPAENKANLVNEEFQKVLEQQGSQIEQQIEQTSKSFKSRLQDDDGQTYLLAIDPYLWYGYAKNYVDHGDFGNGINPETGEVWDYRRNGRIGQGRGFTFPSAAIVFFYKILNLFDRDISVLTVAFLLPLILITLAVIPTYLFTKIIVGDFGALVASSLFAVHSALMTRTVAGFSDTDPYTVFFPVLFVWLISSSFLANIRLKRIIYAALTAISTIIFILAWTGWWYIFAFSLAAFGIYLVILVIHNLVKAKKSFYEILRLEKIKKIYEVWIYYFITIFVFAWLMFFTIGESYNIPKMIYIALIRGPLNFLALKAVAITTIWPNVMTTVAELNPSSYSRAMASMGSSFLFLIAIIGIIFCFKKEFNDRRHVFFGILIAIWLVGTTFAASSSLRFSALMVPVFSIAVGLGTGFLVKYLPRLVNKSLDINMKITKVVLIIVFLVVLIQPIKAGYDAAIHEVPSFNDDWHNALQRIADNSDDAIISSWWDFGHWFVAMGERRVTFDGGNQGKRIHWIGRSLQTSDEKESRNILRMLNCGQEEAYNVLENYTSETEVKDSYLAITTLKSIIGKDRKDAKEELFSIGLNDKQAEDVLKYSHCDDLIDSYMIASEDMVGKAGVWGHFGGWDFKKGAMYNAVKKKKRQEGVQILVEQFNLSEDAAEDTYLAIQNNDADKWVSGWPGYISSVRPCDGKGDKLECLNSVQGNPIKVTVDLATLDAEIPLQAGQIGKPNSLVYADEKGLHEKKFDAAAKSGFSVALIPRADGGYNSLFVSPELAASVFTSMFFYEGHGLWCYDPFGHDVDLTGLDIYTYKVDFDCKDMTIMPAIQARIDAKKEIRASHILVNTSEEAEEIIKLLDEGADFAELAEERSTGPTGSRGGDLGYFKKGMMVKPFDDAAFALEEIGQYTKEPVQTQFGYHVIKLTGKRDNSEVKEEKYSLNNVEESETLE